MQCRTYCRLAICDNFVVTFVVNHFRLMCMNGPISVYIVMAISCSCQFALTAECIIRLYVNCHVALINSTMTGTGIFHIIPL